MCSFSRPAAYGVARPQPLITSSENCTTAAVLRVGVTSRLEVCNASQWPTQTGDSLRCSSQDSHGILPLQAGSAGSPSAAGLGLVAEPTEVLFSRYGPEQTLQQTVHLRGVSGNRPRVRHEIAHVCKVCVLSVTKA